MLYGITKEKKYIFVMSMVTQKTDIMTTETSQTSKNQVVKFENNIQNQSNYGIGFATKFFTLWNVVNDFIYSEVNGKFSVTGTTTTFTYCGKLSICKDKAIQKVKAKGISEFFIDENLRGTRTWSTTSKNYCEFYKSECSVFQFGKYDDQKISECTDIKYLLWYFSETSNKFAKQVLLNSGQYGIFTNEDGSEELLSIEMCNRYQERESLIQTIKKTMTIQFDCSRNLASNGSLKIEIDGKYITDVLFKHFKEMYYNGYSYALPRKENNPASTKIKGRTLKLTLKEFSQNEQENHGHQFEVIDFEIV